MVFDVDGFSLLVGAMNGSNGFVEVVQVVEYDFGDAFNVSELAHVGEVGQLELDGIDKVGHVHGVFAGFVQEEVEVERRFVVGVHGIRNDVGSLFHDFQNHVFDVHIVLRNVCILLDELFNQLVRPVPVCVRPFEFGVWGSTFLFVSP